MRPKRDLVRENLVGRQAKVADPNESFSDEDPPSFDKEPPILSCSVEIYFSSRVDGM